MKNIVTAVEKYRELILSAERYIWQNPETGYKEYKTSAYCRRFFMVDAKGLDRLLRLAKSYENIVGRGVHDTPSNL